MVTHSCTPTWTWADSGSGRYTFLPTGMKFQPHRLLRTCKPSSLRPQSGPHHRLQCQTQLWNLPRPNALAARVGITIAWDAWHTSTLKHPDSTSAKKPSSSKKPAPKEQDKSPKSHSSRKSARCKQKEARTEDTHKLISTLPVSSSGF